MGWWSRCRKSATLGLEPQLRGVTDMNADSVLVQQVEAVFEQGVLRPLGPLTLSDQEHVIISVHRVADAEPPGARLDEQRWLDRHGHEHRGQWVAIDGDRLISHGSRAAAVLEAARRLGQAATRRPTGLPALIRWSLSGAINLSPVLTGRAEQVSERISPVIEDQAMQDSVCENRLQRQSSGLSHPAELSTLLIAPRCRRYQGGRRGVNDVRDESQRPSGLLGGQGEAAYRHGVVPRI